MTTSDPIASDVMLNTGHPAATSAPCSPRAQRPLTARQAQVLAFIRESVATRGFAPSLREIGARMGIRSTNGVNDHLRCLQRKGFITRDDMTARGIRVLPGTAPHMVCTACGQPIPQNEGGGG